MQSQTKLSCAAVLGIVLFGSAPSGAQSITLPSAAAGTTSAVRQLSTAEASYQVVYASSLLASVPTGSQITGIAFRLANGGASAPASGLSYTSYNITLSTTSATPGSLSTTFNNNIGGDSVLVRSGALSIAANAYSGGSTPNSFGPTISFSSFYTYNGGNLLLTIRHGAGTGSSLNLDATANSGVLTQGIQATTQAATTGSSGNTVVARFLYTTSSSAPEPGTLAFLALGGTLTLFARRRRA